MDVKEAIAKSKAYVRDVFSDAPIDDVELEETEFRNGEWRITLSFSRARALPNAPAPTALDILAFAQGRGRKRTFKVVFLHDDDGSVFAVKDRAWMERAE